MMKHVWLLCLSFFIYPAISFGASGATKEIKWVWLVFGLLGGLALFLYGMEKMSEGMKKGAGQKMRSILAALTKNSVIAVAVGAFVTMVIQSSSATTVMLVSFVQAELMTFVQSLGVILGANIGTTITAQLVAFKLTDYALLMIAVGFGIQMMAKKDGWKNTGEAILGFGILFFGMKLMSDAMKPLRSYQEFINLLHGLENPVLGLLVGSIFTALIQSSSAFTGIVIVLAQQQLITLEAGIPLIMGANLGTCITAGLASIGATREAKRVAIAHFLFNTGGVLLFIFWIPGFVAIIQKIAGAFGSDVARQIANGHTIFNVGVGVFFIPFLGLAAKFILRIYPDVQGEKGVVPTTWHLDESIITSPSLAIDLARAEISRMAKIMGRMCDSIILPFTNKDEQMDPIYPQLTLVEGIEMHEKKIDYLEESVTKYLFNIGRQELSDEQAKEVYSLLSVIKDIESVGDIIQKNLLPQIKKKQALKVDFSPEGKEEIETYHQKVCKQVNRLKTLLEELDPMKAEAVLLKMENYLDLESNYRLRHIERVRQERDESVRTHEVHMEVMDLLKQVNFLIGNMAKTIMNYPNIDPEFFHTKKSYS